MAGRIFQVSDQSKRAREGLYAVIGDADNDPGELCIVRSRPGADIDLGGVCVFDDVSQRFLDDAQHLQGMRWIEPGQRRQFGHVPNDPDPGILDALAEGLIPYTGRLAYIFRPRADSAERQEIPIELEQILQRKSPDVALQADDILYIPDNKGRRRTAEIIDRVSGFGTATASGLARARARGTPRPPSVRRRAGAAGGPPPRRRCPRENLD